MTEVQVYPTASSQRGIALVIALVLLIAITLVGLASIRGTTLQEKMAGNFYDRDVAMQAAEAAMRVGAATILETTAVQWRDCSEDVRVCGAGDVLTASDVKWTAVTSSEVPSSARYQAGAFAAGVPEFAVEYMGLWPDFTVPNDVAVGGDLGYETQNTGDGSETASIRYYRITARSSAPTDDNADRAVVVLQGWFRG